MPRTYCVKYPANQPTFLASGSCPLVYTPHSQPRALRHTTVLSNIMSLQVLYAERMHPPKQCEKEGTNQP